MALLDRALAPGGLTTLFQPIWDIADGDPPRLVAVECLTRGPAGSTIEPADILFEYARRRREESLVDRAAITTALRTIQALPAECRPRLQVNVHASTLGRDGSFPTFIRGACDDADFSIDRLTVEVIEDGDLIDEHQFLASVAEVRRAGAQLAIDDIGRGRSDLRMLVLLRPEEIKIDRYLVDGCAADPVRAEVVAALATLAARWGTLLVGEGVETVEDLAKLRELGVSLAQGYLLARPMHLEQLRPLVGA
jgi:EAL domain-containing protein (putative c-di-GMP-specific phosphodiesterase class I)